MDTVLTIILIGFVAGLVMSALRPAPRPEIVYVQVEPQQSGGIGCRALLVFAGVVRFILLALRSHVAPLR